VPRSVGDFTVRETFWLGAASKMAMVALTYPLQTLKVSLQP